MSNEPKLISDMIADINTWIDNQWKQVLKGTAPLPKPSALKKEIATTITTYIANISLPQEIKDSYVPAFSVQQLKSDSLESAALIDVQEMFADRRVIIGTYLPDKWIEQTLPNKLWPLLTIEYATEHISILNQNVEGIISISIAEDKNIHSFKTIEELVLKALDLQKDSGRSIFERWSIAPEQWREQHLVCPICGAKITPYDSGDYGSRKMVAGCDYCQWESTKKYYYPSDFSNIETMTAEVKRYKKMKNEENQFKQQEAALLDAISAFAKSTASISSKNHMFGHYRNATNVAIDELKNILSHLNDKIR